MSSSQLLFISIAKLCSLAFRSVIQKCREWLPGGPETKMGSYFGLIDSARYRAVQYVARKMEWCSAMSFESIGGGRIEKDEYIK